jgi:hypothetical protein
MEEWLLDGQNGRGTQLVVKSYVLWPVDVGKFEKPHCIKDMKHYFYNYRASKNAWLARRVFREWLLCIERKVTCKNRNILLLLDECSALSHRGLTLKHTCLLHLPASITSYMQPLVQGVIY